MSRLFVFFPHNFVVWPFCIGRRTFCTGRFAGLCRCSITNHDPLPYFLARRVALSGNAGCSRISIFPILIYSGGPRHSHCSGLVAEAVVS